MKMTSNQDGYQHPPRFGIGWKLNGRFGAIFRWQSDESAAEGTHGPNYGQATGWECGTK